MVTGIPLGFDEPTGLLDTRGGWGWVGAAAAARRSGQGPACLGGTGAELFRPSAGIHLAPLPRRQGTPRAGLGQWLCLQDVFNIRKKAAFAFICDPEAAQAVSSGWVYKFTGVEPVEEEEGAGEPPTILFISRLREASREEQGWAGV